MPTKTYDPPWGVEEMREHGYPEEKIKELAKDPVHGWRMQTGIELIHREPTRTELMRIWSNWQLMSKEQKEISEKKCKELFGCTNKELYDYLLPQYKVETPGKDAVKYPPKSSLEALAEKATHDGLLYHGSPYSFSVLKPQPMRDVGGKKALSLSPFKGIASMFIIPFEELKKGYKSCMFGCREWFKSPEDKYSPLTTVHIYHNIKERGHFEKIYTGYLYAVSAEEALKDASDNPRWKVNKEVLTYVPEIHPVKVEKIQLKMIADYDVTRSGAKHDAIPEGESSEAIKTSVSSNIKNGLVYCARVHKYPKLLGSATGAWSGEKGNVFVTPCKGIASCFVVSRNDILDAVEKQLGKRVVSCNFGYDVWNKPISTLYTLPKKVTVELNVRGFKPFSGVSTGYLYTIDFNQYKDKCHMFNKNQNSDVEFCIEGDVDYIKCEKISVAWECVPSEQQIKLHGEGALEGYKPGQMKITDINSINDLKSFYKTVKYGVREGKEEDWHLGTYRGLVHYQQGICYDTAAMSDYFLTKWGIQHRVLFLYTDEKHWANNPTHLTVIYFDKSDNKWKWLEGSWNSFKNNNWSEQAGKVLAMNIAKAHANSCHKPTNIGIIDKIPADGISMIDFYNIMRSQAEKMHLGKVEPDAKYAKEDLSTVKSISFPEDEIPVISKQSKIITTRVSADYNKYAIDDLVKTPWGKIYKVVDRIQLSSIEDHPYYKELTKEQITFLSKYDKIAVLTLELQKDVSTEGLQKEELPESVKNKLGKYLYHGTHRDLDIKQLAVHFCKNRANLDIKAPVVYMTRTLGLACLHCVEFMKGHASKMKGYKEHFVDFDKAKNSDSIIKHVEIVHNDPNLPEASGENDGFIYCTETEKCVDKLYFSTPKDKNDYLFVSYSPLPVDKKIKVHVTWHRKYDEAFAKEAENNKYAGVESLELEEDYYGMHDEDMIPDSEEISIDMLTNQVSMEEDVVQEQGTYVIIRGFPVAAFFRQLSRHYQTHKLENLIQIVRSVGITQWVINTRTVKIHRFFLPEIVYLLNKFGMSQTLIGDIQRGSWMGAPITNRTDCKPERITANMTCTLMPHQQTFVENYADLKDLHRLRGYLLSFGQGLGKTVTAIALMEALNKERVIVICPKNTMVETWKSHFQRFYKKEQSIYVAGFDKEFNGERFCIFNYDAIDKLNALDGVKKAKMGIIVDESHNFLRMQSARTKKLIDLAKSSEDADVLLVSGTPIKASSQDLIPLISVLDPYFDDDATRIFRESFGVNTKIATEVLHARLKRMMERVTKDVLDLPPKRRSVIKVKLPDGQKYTVTEVKKGMAVYINERLKFHRDHMVEYRQEFDDCMKYLRSSQIGKTEEFHRYELLINRLIKNSGQFDQGDEEVAWANAYEKSVVEKQFPSDLLAKFRHCKAAIKYLQLKVRGEVLGQFLARLRIEMTTKMLKAVDLKQLIDEAEKKTIIFTSYIDTIETCEKYVRSLGYKPIVIYGKNSGDIAPLAAKFQKDQSFNPLIASLQTLSTGATLTAANRVIFLNKPWRSVDYEQASDRVHRIGQDTAVDIISLVLDTGEEGNLSTRMEDIMDASARAFDAIVEEKKKIEDRKDRMSKEDYVFDLLDLPDDVLDEENISLEGMTLLNDTKEQRTLNRMAKPHYRPRGANSWEHVQQDMANGILLVKELKHRDLTLQEYATILYHDCGCKSMYPDKEGHGLRGVEIAKPELKKCGFFSEKEIDEICTAILEHDETTNPKNMHSSELSDLLASADTNPPDIPWILNKSYVWGLRHGYSDHNKNIENVVSFMKKENGTHGNMIYPKLYSEYYKKEIKRMQEFFDNLTVEECSKIIDEYRKDNDLRHNELTLPEPDTDQKIVEPSEEGMMLLDKTKEQRELNRLAKPFYIAKGQNSWEHIQQDMFNGISMLKKLKHRDITLQEYATILFHDCAYKTHPDGEKHGIYGAEIARPVLEKTGFFTDKEIDEICQAIVEHDFSSNKEQKFSSDLSDFLISADSNPINIAWIMNKCYSWGIRHGKTHEEAVQHVVDFEPTIYSSKGKFVYPKMYKAYYGDKIKEMQKFFDHVTYEQADQIITDYRKRHHLSSSDTRLPDPSLEGMTARYASMQFANNPVKKKIWNLGKKYYEKTGSHGVNHIQEVLATAYVLKGKEDLTDVEYAAIIYHDVGRPQETKDKHHNVISAEIAKKELPLLNVFTDEQLDAIYEAITNHSHSWRKVQNVKLDTLDNLSALVAYADRGFPQTSYYEICLRPTLWILEGNDRDDNPAKMKRLNNYRTIDDIAQGVYETLEDIKDKRHSANENSIYTRAFAREIAKQNDLREKISVNIIKPVVVKIMKDYGYTKAVGAEGFSTESLEPSMEAVKNIKEKRKKIEDYILKSMKLLDPHTDTNYKYWKNKFDSMSDKDFDNFMHYLREGKTNIHMFVPPFKVTLQTKEMLDAAHKLGVKIMHRIWMHDPHTGIDYLTPEEYMVLQLPVRRQQQFLDEKLSVPDNDKTIDGLTGQVSGDSKSCSITNPEIQILHARNLDATLYEFANVRGGNIRNYAEFKRSLEETGSVKLEQLDPTNRTRVAVMGQVLLTAMHFDVNMVDI